MSSAINSMKKSIPMKQIIPKTSPNPCNLSINKTLTHGKAVKDIDLFITKRLKIVAKS